jgi:hypothetical protein
MIVFVFVIGAIKAKQQAASFVCVVDVVVCEIIRNNSFEDFVKFIRFSN